MESNAMGLTGSEKSDVQALGRAIERHVEESWAALLDTHQDRLGYVYERSGDQAYGVYADLLFKPVHQALRQAGLRATPKLPGEFDISREWGNADESDQQRWMWSTIRPAKGAQDEAPLGTIVTILFHDHTRFRLPRRPQVLALVEVGKEAVAEALSRRSDEFRKALEFSVAYAEYLKHEAEAAAKA
ncbi:DUF6022 family protein [Chondromyces apiculatus]|uniref:Uncharacterized protein n=1 Tax=Chondromyces apiculatus DSM 436 TaxID=1192034 RepID=A0A017TB58_9BACT|nr:DUF6022 family protein [Chondromyces apiculatus]EYF06137.1 Hypothetical protein CAP_2327 [Chondromyces apiculatus DSM 436]